MKTSSTYHPGAVRPVRGTHAFKIEGYSQNKGLGVGRFVDSAAFDVCGHTWCIRFYHDGERKSANADNASVFLKLVSKDARARARFELRLVDQAGELPPLPLPSEKRPVLFTAQRVKWGGDFPEQPAYLRDDSLVVECDLAVETNQVPPSNLSGDLRALLEAEEETDVTFEVGGEAFPAHKIVLAMRSPVFKALLFGPMCYRERRTVAVDDMLPAVFKSLLHFIYTDSLGPRTEEDLGGDDGQEMVKHLLVAADRYGMERMKLICESILFQSLDVENAIAVLAFADQFQCTSPRDACLRFITSPDRMDVVLASKGYAQLKRPNADVIIDVYEFERATKCRKI